MQFLRKLYRHFWVLPRIHRYYKKLSLSETFNRIYSSGAWADGSGETFCSGSGSQGKAADEYYEKIIEFMRTHGIQSVADLGCGDFRVGRRFTSETSIRYVGVDIVRPLIERNNAQFGNERISFQCADLVTDPLPEAQLCLVRQVLQHLSNAEIQSVLAQLSSYPFCLISEHVPKFPKRLNQDKPHGPDVREYYGSGVYVEKPPFSRRVEVAWETELDDSSLLRTVLMVKH